ncbi:MAG: YigZ family protein, partial [Deinococcota bacterium]|nr:YigZ family protein [Deinococcota bacterium]
MSYLTVAGPGQHEEIIKGSRFLGFVAQVDSVEEALAFVEGVRERYRGASHHPWAYMLSPEYRFSDDGEPGGTAGRPMLEVLQRRELDRVIAVVTRYFGGTKLGAGGLVRAY